MKDRAFIIAEIGLNHNGDYSFAQKLIEQASQAGADAVKFQNWKTEDFIFDRSLKYTYISQGKKIVEPMWDLCKRHEMPAEWLPKLKRLCDDVGIVFLSTPTSSEGVDDLVALGVKYLKNGSDYLMHLPLLRYMGSAGATVIISTGMADQIDVQEAVEATKSGGDCPIVLLHCTSSYPTIPEETNLNRMLALREAFGLAVGFSDHTVGSAAAIQAVTLGACMLEKHYTLDHDLPGPDHWFSVNPEELKQYVDDVRAAEQRMGFREVKPAQVELQNRKEFRLSLVAKRDLPAGHCISESDFVVTKPGTGLPPKESAQIIGLALKTDVTRGRPLQWADFR